MPVAKKPSPPEKAASEEKTDVMCDNHPDVHAAHTTNTPLHQPISLCSSCLKPVEHLRNR